MRPVLQYSRGGALAAGGFLSLAMAVVGWVFVAALTNPADSGESGVLLLPFVMPWIALLPSTWLGPGIAVACLLLNAFILFCVFGGLRPSRGQP